MLCLLPCHWLQGLQPSSKLKESMQHYNLSVSNLLLAFLKATGMCMRCTRFTCIPQAQRALARSGLRPGLCCAQPPRATEREALLQAAHDAGFQVRTARADKRPCLALYRQQEGSQDVCPARRKGTPRVQRLTLRFYCRREASWTRRRYLLLLQHYHGHLLRGLNTESTHSICWHMQDTLAQSAVKGLIWRLFSTGISVAVALLVFSNVEGGQALMFGGSEAALKFTVYFAFERLWLRLRKVQLPEWPP